MNGSADFSETPVSAYAVLRFRDYRLFLGMRMMATLGIQIMSVSVGYYIYELTSSALNLGLIGLAEALPAISISLYAGHVADKRSRRDILIVCMLVLFICALMLLGLAFGRDQLSTHLLIGGLYGVIFLTGIARGFFSPTNFAFLPQLIDKKLLPNAITWNSSTWEVASISGLGLGGLLYGFFGVKTAFTAMACLFFIGFLFVSYIRPRPVPPLEAGETASRRIREGLGFVFNHRIILAAIALDLFAVLFGGAVALLPIFIKDILHKGPAELGILRAAMSIGAIVMAFFIAHRQPGAGAGKLMLGCVAGFGLSIIAFGLSSHYWLSFFLLMAAGMFDEVSVFVRASLLQLLTPDRLKGRVSSVNSIFITSSNEIGAFESGLAAHFLGARASVVFGGLMTLLVVGLTWWKAPSLRRLDLRVVSAALSEPEKKV